MAKSYTQLKTDYGINTKNTSSANLTYGDGKMNTFIKRLLAKKDWPFLHRLRTATTVASTSFVALPYDVDQVESVFVTVSNTRYNPKPAPSRKFWDELHYSSYNSDTPEYWFVYNGQIGLWPQPSSSGNIISCNSKIKQRDLNIDDITGTTITTLANGSTALTVSGGLTTQMAGFWIRPTFSTTANTGDGLWYEISSVTNATTAVLAREYGGDSIAAGTAACTISQLPILPEAFHDLPETYASYMYWLKEKDSRADGFKAELEEGLNIFADTYGLNDLSMVIDDGEDGRIINPNLKISL